MKKRMIGVLLTALLVPATVSANSISAAAASTRQTGDALPSAVDLRNFNGKNYVTPAKNQAPFGSCWSFALAAAAETSYLTANDLGVPAGEENNTVNFSEKHIVWYIYHGITEDDVEQGRVRASQVGEGFDLTEAESKMPNSAYNMGGEFVQGADFFASGFGPVDESVSVDGAYPFVYSGNSANGGWTLPLNAQYRNASSDAVLRSTRMLPSPAGKDESGSYAFSQEGVNSIRSEIAQGRAVVIAFYASGSRWNETNWTLYNNYPYTADHAVTVVGYDDNYSKDNFTRHSKSGKLIKNSTPPGDGAFIVKNSWGSWGIEGSGYFYLSYYDQSIVSAMSFEFDGSAGESPSSTNYDQYDLMMTCWYGDTDYDSETKTANVFDAEEDSYLAQITCHTAQPDTAVRYEVYRDVKGAAPDTGVLLEQGEASFEYGGFHKLDLKNEYYLKKGEKYAVVLTMTRAEGDKATYTEVLPYATNFNKGLTAHGVVNAGESYRYTDGTWTDVTELKDDMIERAYLQCNAAFEGRDTSTPIDLENKSSFVIDNYPIKALLIPADTHDKGALLGDADGNGLVNINDVTAVQRHVAQVTELIGTRFRAADVNNDGLVNINDATELQRFLADFKTNYPIRQPMA